ncbi:MAG: DUF559 domain-containing protein [bacterium]|nr:DUF559 domain-containing protein [bacterium]MDA1292561.1 DUF559 domain-containing protein [bacterium]
MLPEEKQFWLRKKESKRFARKLRKRMTEEEIILWEVIRLKNFCGLRMRKQVPIGPYIVDFLQRKQRLIIEIDGKIHLQRKEYDAAREEYLRGLNYSIIRFSNKEIHDDLPKVLSEIARALHKTNVPLPNIRKD